MSRLILSVAFVLLSLATLCRAQTVTFTQATTAAAFPSREYSACAQSQLTNTTTPTLYFFGGFSVTLTASGTTSYTDGYFNDAWSSTNLGQTWTQLATAAPFRQQGWNGAVATNTQGIIYIGGGNDNNTQQNNEVWQSTNGGATWNSLGNGPWDPRENAGIAGQRGTDNILVALGNTKNDFNIDDIWLSTNGGAAGSWTRQCYNTSCPFVTTISGFSTSQSAQVHGPAAAGLSTGQWLLIGGYGSDNTGTSGATTWVTNEVAVSTNGFQSFTTYAAPWSPRAQQRAVVDYDNFVYVYGGIYNLPVTPNSAQPWAGSQAYYQYYTDIWYSTNAASSSATWTQLSAAGGLGSAGYPGTPYAGNPNNVNSAFFTQGAVFNPCLGVSQVGSTKQLVLYTGLYAGYRQNNATGITVVYPGVYVGALSLPASNSSGGGSTSTGGNGASTGGNGASSVSVSMAGVVMALAVALASLAL